MTNTQNVTELQPRMTREQLTEAARIAAKFLPVASAQLMNELANRLDITSVALCEAMSQRKSLAAENAGLKKALTTIANSEEFHGDTVVCDFDTLVTTAWSALNETPATDAFLAEVRAQESKRVYESILDNPAVTDMESLVDWLEQNANDSAAFAVQLRKGVQS